MKNTLLLILGVITLLYLDRPTMACSCAPKGSPCEAYSSATAIFIGLVTSSKITTHDRSRSGLYQIKVEEVFLGTLADNIEAASSDMLCGYEFKDGKRYLIYTHGGQQGTYFVTYCSRTRPIEEAEEDLNFLRVERFKMSGGRIYGSVLWDYSTDNSLPKDQRHPPLAGIKVVIEGEGDRLELIADEKGWYEVQNVKPGRYSIEVSLPPGAYGNGGKSRKRRVNDRGCAKGVFYVNNRGER
jgi:hypothetical protein